MKSSAEFLSEAARILDAREVTHGGKAENHLKLAVMWSAYLKIRMARWDDLKPSEAADLMALLKLTRKHTGSFNEDDDLDQTGYSAIAGELRGLEQANAAMVDPRVAGRARRLEREGVRRDRQRLREWRRAQRQQTRAGDGA